MCARQRLYPCQRLCHLRLHARCSPVTYLQPPLGPLAGRPAQLLPGRCKSLRLDQEEDWGILRQKQCLGAGDAQGSREGLQAKGSLVCWDAEQHLQHTRQ
jgi:hypothetical protein